LQEARSDFMRPLRLPPKALRQLSQLKSEHQRIYQDERRSARVAELAERTNIDLEQAQALLVADARERSLDEPIGTKDTELGTLGDLLEDPLSAAAYEEVADAVAGEQLRALLSRLTDREREVVRTRFGFDAPAEKLSEVGERLGVSAERVRQIEERALAKLRSAGCVT
jgi:RNA polymerase sigma factor (sigma-70 family)